MCGLFVTYLVRDWPLLCILFLVPVSFVRLFGCFESLLALQLVHLDVPDASARAVEVPCEDDSEDADHDEDEDDDVVALHCGVGRWVW
jgi:hypothetical protein